MFGGAPLHSIWELFRKLYQNTPTTFISPLLFAASIRRFFVFFQNFFRVGGGRVLIQTARPTQGVNAKAEEY